MRTHVILRDELVEEVDRRVGKRRRSEFINAAVEERLQRLRLVESTEAVAGSLKDVDIPGWETEASTRELGATGSISNRARARHPCVPSRLLYTR